MSSTAERRILPMHSRRTSSVQRPSGNRNETPADPADMIGGLSIRDEASDQNSSTLLTPPREARLPGAAIRFGDVTISSKGLLPFTFGELYNVTPLPSPRPSPQPSPEPSTRRNEQQLPLSSLSQLNDLSPRSQRDTNESSRLSLGTPTWSFTQNTRRLSDASAVGASVNAVPYDVNSEQVPVEPFFDPPFQATLTKGIDLAQRVADALVGDHLECEHDTDLTRLWNDARRLSIFQTSDTRTVAVLGDSGEGKSSLINSLLHCPEIAKTGDIGTACTSVVTEYHQKTREQQAPFTVQVEYLSESEMKELMEELVWSYRQLYLPNIEQEASLEDYKRYKAESEHAWSALEAAFGHRPEFRKEFLRDESAEAADKIVTQLLDWTKDLDWPEGGNNGVWNSTAETAEDCCDKTAVFMKDRLWPFTKIIRIYLSAQVLKTGIILADLPGLHDTNLARVRATEQYLLRCDHILTVAGISRAISDQSLKSSLYTALSQYVPNEWETSAGKYLNVSVVCTKTEIINVKTHKKEFCGVGKRIDPDVMDALDQQIEQAKNADNRTLKKELKRRQEFLLIGARNDFVKEGLKRNYSEKVPGGILEVFCVSNLKYEKFSRKGVVDYVNASGVPALRRFCHTITAKPQYFEAKNYLQSSLASLLTSVSLWVEKEREPASKFDKYAKEISFVEYETMHQNVEIAVKRTERSFLNSFQEQLLQMMDNRNGYWEKAAKQKSNEWNYWHTTQYNAWCRNNGTHCTEKRGSVCWNSQMIWKMKSELDYAWDIIEEEIPEVFEDLTRSFRTDLKKFESAVRCFGKGSTFANGIDSRITQIEYLLNTTQRAFGREYKTVRRNASEHNYSSYVLKGMLPAYRTASKISGTGRTRMQQNTVQGRITKGNLFPIISFSIKQDVDKLISTTFAELTKKADAVLGLMRADLELVYGELSVQDGLNDGEDDIPRLLNHNKTRVRDQNQSDEDPDSVNLEDFRNKLRGQLEIFEKELGEIQEVISGLHTFDASNAPIRSQD